MWHVKKKDKVVILAGKDKGKEGEVIEVDRKKGRVLVAKLNMNKKHAKATQMEPAGIKEKEAYLPASKVMLVCPKTNRPTRVKFDKLSDGTKVRISLASGEAVG
jgi:large subunit ribosomal protein L24